MKSIVKLYEKLNDNESVLRMQADISESCPFLLKDETTLKMCAQIESYSRIKFLLKVVCGGWVLTKPELPDG